MWSFLKRFSSFFAIVKEEKLSKEEEDEIISNAFSKESLDLVSVDDGKTFQRLNGTITFTNYTTSVIDGKYYFHLKDSISPNLFVGDYVEFVFNETESKVMNVRKISNVDADPKAITMDHLKIKGENNEYFSVNGVIKNRIGRIVVVINEENPLEEIDFNLDCVCSEFIPSQGDFITLEGQIIDNQLSVNKIRPTITTIKSGIVTKWDVARGIISDFAWFTLESCEPGYIPIEGDKVLASLIRIDDPKGYMWRAIQVVNVFQNIGSFSQNDGEPRPDLICNHYGIFIPVLPKFTMQINKVMEFTVDVENNNSYNVELLLIFCNAGFEAQQISLISPIGKCSVIPSHRKLTCTFKIEAKYIGHSTIEYTWDFGEFELTRMFSLEVTSAELEELEFSLSKNQMPNPQFKITGLEILKQTYGDKMPGQKKYFRSSIYPVQLGQYPLPDQILLAALPQHKMNPDDLLIQIEKIIPSLREELSPKTYLPFLSGLLFLEEVELLRQIGELSMERAHFTKTGDFLVLSLPPYSAYTHKLMSGDRAIASLPWNDKGNSDFKFEGIIHRISQNEVWMQFSKQFHYSYQQGTQYSLSFIVSRVSLRRMHQAVHLAKRFLGDQWLFPTGVQISSPRIIFDSSPSDEVCVKKSKSYTKVNWNRQGSGYGKNCSIENSIDVDIGPKRISEITWFNKELNNEQKEAITNILKGEARPLPYIIFGPPGTGKSVTFVETILQLHNLFPSCRILVATPSNSAADLLAERILEHGNVQQNKMLRLVGLSAFEQGKIAASLLPYTAMIDVKNDDDERYGVQVITREALKQFNIVIGTIGCVNVLFNLGFPRGFFTHIFVDEAGQATEPEILTVLVLLNTLNGQVILAGDPLQLGPVAYSKLAIKYGFQESLLSRLLDRFPYKRDVVGFPKSYGYDPRLVTKLVNNYRSLPPILQLPNMLFYNGDLIPKVLEKSSEESNLLSRLKLPLIFGKPEGNTPPLVFHGVQGMNHQENCSHSWYNPQEAYQVFAYLNMLYEAGVSPDHIGIITPYQLQVIKIRQMLEKVNMESPKIGSVEEFQGQEKMIIILSVVRSNLEFISYDTQRALGFVRNPRRLNVAISRARAMLIIIGNPHLLCLDQHWKKIIQFCISNKYYTGCDLPSGLT
ncbi:probable RNA helicase armi isoform X1 [Halyomorpha halys]|uniref:probable RNA helicase armi isoform X1 n=1 Tax=Halyomorpha halys TaxID=286706 RepID=UPI0006D5233E|nr:probable RNA helicase armi [Halyomorpha halys]XP_014272863.1 probable RNA helicase armi [Halyomorpha halys]